MAGAATMQLVGLAHLVAWHLGSLHRWETALLVLIAFGPFVVLAAVVAVQRRRNAHDGDTGRG
jgi:hypothetical protein